jgi:hypothetical protein
MKLSKQVWGSGSGASCLPSPPVLNSLKPISWGSFDLQLVLVLGMWNSVFFGATAAESCARTAVKLEEMMRLLENLAVEKLTEGDEEGARQVLQVWVMPCTVIPAL